MNVSSGHMRERAVIIQEGRGGTAGTPGWLTLDRPADTKIELLSAAVCFKQPSSPYTPLLSPRTVSTHAFDISVFYK